MEIRHPREYFPTTRWQIGYSFRASVNSRFARRRIPLPDMPTREPASDCAICAPRINAGFGRSSIF
jgi:hypothetical protein